MRRRTARDPRRARPPFTRAGPLFGGRGASVFEARRRLTTSATATTYGQRPGLFVSSRSWKEAATSVPLLMCRAPHHPKMSRVHTRRAAQHPDDPVPRSVPPGSLPACPTSNLARSAPPSLILTNERGVSGVLEGRSPSNETSLTVRGFLDRAKDASPNHDAGGAARVGCVRLGSRTPTTFPSSAPRRHPTVAGAIARRGGVPLRTVRTGRGHRSRGAPRRATRSWRPGCLPPSRSRTASGFLRIDPRRPPLRAAHTFSPGWGKVPLKRALRSRALVGPRAELVARTGETESEHLWKPAEIASFESDARTWD